MGFQTGSQKMEKETNTDYAVKKNKIIQTNFESDNLIVEEQKLLKFMKRISFNIEKALAENEIIEIFKEVKSNEEEKELDLENKKLFSEIKTFELEHKREIKVIQMDYLTDKKMIAALYQYDFSHTESTFS